MPQGMVARTSLDFAARRRYAVHHSSGRLSAVGPHSAGNITGLTLIDFLALPPKARVSVTYQGEEGGEGFIGLRKM